jgi:hypothetical protein
VPSDLEGMLTDESNPFRPHVIRALLMMIEYLFTIPTGAGTLGAWLYITMCNAWQDNRAAINGPQLLDPQDNETCNLHGILLDVLSAANGAPRETGDIQAAIEATSGELPAGMATSSHEMTEDWPEQGISKGDYVIVETSGKARPGQLAYFHARTDRGGVGFVSILHEERKKSLIIEGSDHAPVDVRDVVVEGEVIAIVRGRGIAHIEKLLSGRIPVSGQRHTAERATQAEEGERSHEDTMQLVKLQSKLEHLEYAPENEAVRLQLESEIYNSKTSSPTTSGRRWSSHAPTTTNTGASKTRPLCSCE